MGILLKLIMVILSGCVSWVIAALQYHKKIKDGRTKEAKRAIRWLFFLIPACVLATGISVYYDQSTTEKAQQANDDLSRENAKALKEIEKLSGENAEASKNIVSLTRKLAMPSVDVLSVSQKAREEEPYFVINAKNTGNNECYDARLYIDRHNSPLVDLGTIINCPKLPKDGQFEYSIPILKSEYYEIIFSDEDKEEYKRFISKYANGSPIVVYFHFEYEWEGETLKSSQYCLVKRVNESATLSVRDEYVEPMIDRSEWKWE